MGYIPSITLDEWNGSYVRRLGPFVAFSMALHLLIACVFIGMGMLSLGKGTMQVKTFDPGNPALNPISSIWSGLINRDRPRVIRVDFFSQVIPWTPPPPLESLQLSGVTAEPTIESKPPEETEKPPEEKIDEKPETEPSQEASPEESVQGSTQNGEILVAEEVSPSTSNDELQPEESSIYSLGG
jgi:hypothetical protein